MINDSRFQPRAVGFMLAGMMLASSIAVYAETCVSAATYTVQDKGGKCYVVDHLFGGCSDEAGIDGSCKAGQPAGYDSCSSQPSHNLQSFTPNPQYHIGCSGVTCTGANNGHVLNGFTGSEICPHE